MLGAGSSGAVFDASLDASLSSAPTSASLNPGSAEASLSSVSASDAGKTGFTDVTADHWAAEYIERAAENGWVEGFGDGSFRPDKPVTYAQWLTMLGNLYYPEQIKRAQSGGYWYDQAVNASRDEGILAGSVMLELWGGAKLVHGEGADYTICRYEMAKTIANLSYYLYRFRTEALQKTGTSAVFFNDISMSPIYGYYRDYYRDVQLCASLGLLEGKGDGRFDGQAPMKRCEAAAVLCRLADTFISHPLRTDEQGNVIDPDAADDPDQLFFPGFTGTTQYGPYTGGKYGPENQYAAYTRPEDVPQDLWDNLIWAHADLRRDYSSPYVRYTDHGDGSGIARFVWQDMLRDYLSGELDCLSVPDFARNTDWDFSDIVGAYEHVGRRYGITADSSDYDKIYAIHSYLSSEYEYDYALMNNQVNLGGIPSPVYINYAIGEKSTICQGFAEMMEALCRMYGMDCLVVTSDNHAWNLVRVDGFWYHCDPCWDCCTYNRDADFRYFLLSDDRIRSIDSHHSWKSDAAGPLPDCPRSYSELSRL